MAIPAPRPRVGQLHAPSPFLQCLAIGLLAIASCISPPATATEAVCGAILSDGSTPSSIFYIEKDMLVVSSPARIDASAMPPGTDGYQSLLQGLFDAAMQKVMARNDLGGFRMRREQPIRCRISEGDTLTAEELDAWQAELRRNTSRRAGQHRAIEPERTVTLDALLPPEDAAWLHSTYFVGCHTFIPYRTPGALRSRAEAFDASKGVPDMRQVRRHFIAKAIEVAGNSFSSSARDLDTYASCGVLGLPQPNPHTVSQNRFFPDIRAESRMMPDIPLDLGASAKAAPAVAPAEAKAAPAIIIAAPAGPSPEQQAAERERERREAAIEAEKQRLGAHREAEIRRLEALRERAAAATPKCTEKSITVNGHSAQDAPSPLFAGWATREEASQRARAKLGYWCAQMTGNTGFGTVSEQCTQNSGRWECKVETTCSAPQRLCGAATQW